MYKRQLTTGLDMCTRYSNAVMLIDMPQPHEVNECLDHLDEASERIMELLARSNSLVLCNVSHLPYPAMVEAEGGYVMRTPKCDDIGASIRKSLPAWHWYDCDMASAFSTYFGYTTVQQPEAASVVIPLSDAELVPGKPFATSPGIVSGSVAYSKSAGGLCFDTAPAPSSTSSASQGMARSLTSSGVAASAARSRRRRRRRTHRRRTCLLYTSPSPRD